jgi:hypothetical protein
MQANQASENFLTDHQVMCYSGVEYAERPRAFFWQGILHKVVKIQARWLTPDGKFFLVRTSSNQLYNLFYNPASNAWEISPC